MVTDFINEMGGAEWDRIERTLAYPMCPGFVYLFLIRSMYVLEI